MATSSPGTWWNQASRLWACCAADERPGPALGAEHNRHPGLPARHVADLGRLVGQLVHGHGRKVDVHILDHRPQPGDGRADRRAGKALLANGCLDDALLAENRRQAQRDLVGAAKGVGNVLAQEKDALVALSSPRSGLL
jgi:hypothetical protein